MSEDKSTFTDEYFKKLKRSYFFVFGAIFISRSGVIHL